MTSRIFASTIFRFILSLGALMILARSGLPAVFSKQNQKPIAELDFELNQGQIFVPGEINGHPTWIVLDSGAGTEVMDLGLANQWHFSGSENIGLSGAGEELAIGRSLTSVTAKIGGIPVPVSYAIPLAPLAFGEGRQVPAIVGYTFFKEHIIEIDYARRHLRIFGKTLNPLPLGTELPIRLVEHIPQIVSTMVVSGKELKLSTMIDTGAMSSAVTARFFLHRSLKVPMTAKTILGGGVGGLVYGRSFRPASVTFGSITFPMPVLKTSEVKSGALSKEAQYEFLLGSDFLRRFVVTFDYPHLRMFVDPNQDVFEPFEAEKTGMRIYSEGKALRSFRVIAVLGGSSSEKAGVKADDMIESIDGFPTSALNLEQLRKQFLSPTAKGWTLGIRRNGKLLTILVAARSII